MTDSLQKMVFASLDNAVENGYAMAKMSNPEIAIDLCCYDADLENYKPDDLIPFIKVWRERQ